MKTAREQIEDLLDIGQFRRLRLPDLRRMFRYLYRAKPDLTASPWERIHSLVIKYSKENGIEPPNVSQCHLHPSDMKLLKEYSIQWLRKTKPWIKSHKSLKNLYSEYFALNLEFNEFSTEDAEKHPPGLIYIERHGL